MIRCDTSMKRSKEEAVKQNPHIRQWRCDKDCEKCICGMKPTHSGAWEHNNTELIKRR